MSFVYRTRLASQTDVPVIAQPYICGVEHVNSDGEFDLVADAITAGASDFQISFATESFARIDVVFEGVSALTLTQIVDAINAKAVTLAVEPPLSAYADAGVLRVVARNSGYVSAASSLAFIEVLPEDAGYADLAPLLGFARHPHPSARVTAGDLASTSPRAMTQGNRPTSSFIARGEDRTSESFNRALHSLAKNLDTHQLQLDAGIAVPVVLEIAEDSNRLIENPTTGEIVAIDLRGGFGDGLDSVLASKIFVGIPHTSSLSEIAKYFSLLDSEWNELLSYSGNGVVRVGTIARIAPAAAPGGKTAFSADGTATSPLATNDSFSVYRNALGHASRKQESTPVTSIIDGHTIVCEGAAFEINGVTIGDVVRITGAITVSPTSNNRYLLVEQVISNTEIIVRPLSDEALYPLNDASGESLEVWTNGTFESSLYLHLEPALPRIPEGGLKLLLGMHSALGNLPSHVLLVPALHSAEEVDGWVLRNLHQNMNLSGVYQGQGQGKGGGFFTEITGRPITLHMNPAFHSPEQVLSEVGGTILAGNIFEAPKDVTFTLEDVGRSLYITIGTVVYSDWRVTRLLDARTIELAPPTDEIGSVLPTGTVTSFQSFDSTWREHRAAVSAVTESPDAGGFHYTKMNDSSTFGKLSFAHLEHLTHAAQISDGTIREVGRLSGTFSAGVVTALQDAAGDSVDVDDLWGVYPATDSGGTRVENSHGGKTLISIIQGTPIEDVSEWAGFFVLYSVSPTSIEIRNMDGTEAALTGDATFQMFTLRSGVGVPVFVDGEPATAAMAIHQASDPEASVDARYVGLRVGWTGNGNGVLITANDPSFAALEASVGVQHVSRGHAIKIQSFSPAGGISVDITGHAPATTMEGRGFAGVEVNAETFRHKLSSAESARTPEGFLSSGAVVGVQSGLDPAGAFIRKSTTSPIPSPSELSPLYPAAVVAESWQHNSQGAGVGIALRGDLFGWDNTGVYVDGEVTGCAVFPPTTELYAATPRRMGQPDVLLQAETFDVLSPDYAEFNFSHDYILEASSNLFSNRRNFMHGLAYAFAYSGLIIGVKDSKLAIRNLGAAVSPGIGITFSIFGGRWEEAYLSIADYAFVGTGSGRDPATFSLFFSGQQLSNRYLTAEIDFTAKATPETVSSAIDAGASRVGARVSAVHPSIPVPTVDNASAVDFAAAYSWPTVRSWFALQDPWTSAGASAAPIDCTAEMASENGVDTYWTPANRVSAFNRDFYLVAGQFLTPSTQFGGCIVAAAFPSAGEISLSKRLGSLVFKKHLAYKVTLRMAISGASGSITVALGTLTPIGVGAFRTLFYEELVAESLPLVADASKVQIYEASLQFHEDVYFRSSTADVYSSATAIDKKELVAVVSHASASQLTVVEFDVAEDQLPIVTQGPQVVTGSLTAQKFRYASAVRGFETVGPQSAHFLYGLDYALGGGIPASTEYQRFGAAITATDAHVIVHKNTPWAFYVPETSSYGGIVSATFDAGKMFFRGIDSISVVGSLSAFDPAALVYEYVASMVSPPPIGENLRMVSFPGKTGFIVPFEPPHGSLLTSLSLNLSFMPGTKDALGEGLDPDSADVYWGVYRSIGGWRPGTSVALPTSEIMFESLVASGCREKWEDGAGVLIHLWRYRNTGESASGAYPESSITDHTQEYGYPEKIWTTSIALEDPPTPEEMRVNQAGTTGFFGSKEVFVKRNFDLTQSAVAAEPFFTADRRRFSYFVTIEFYIGMREYDLLTGELSIPGEASVADGGLTNFTGQNPDFNSSRLPWGQPGEGMRAPIRKPPQVKFRGLRVGYLSNSPSHGGW